MTNQPSSAFGGAEVQPFKRLSSTRQDPETAAVIDKLVRSSEPGRPALRAEVSGRRLSNGTLQRISQEISRDIYDAKSLIQLLPDLELVRQIIISLIMSPKDMGPGEIQYRVDKGRFSGEVTKQMLDVIRDHFKNVYKIDELAPEILSDVMFENGSFPMLLLPENTIDAMINDPRRVSLESVVRSPEYQLVMSDHIGLLGPAQLPPGVKPGMEDFGNPATYRNYSATIQHVPTDRGKPVDLKLRVIDNPDVLKRSRLQDRLRNERTTDALTRRGLGPKLARPEQIVLGAEALIASNFTGGVGNGGAQSINFGVNSMYRQRRQHYTHMQVVPTPSELSRGSIGHPLVMNLPSEAVIPLHVPGDPKTHVAYFILLDEHYNPVSRESSFDYYTEMGTALQSQSSMPSQLITSTRRASEGARGNQEQRLSIQELEQAYIHMVESDLQKRLANGVSGNNIQIARPHDVYRLMLTRSYQQRQTQLLYVPAEMLTYVAFDYNEYGVGVSMLQRSKIIGGMRAALLFANTQASLKNSIARTKLRINLDPEDVDPEHRVEQYINHHVKNSRGLLPIGINEPNDILQFMANAAVEVEVTGNNPMYPETSLMVEDYNSNANKPDTELEDSLKARHHMMFGLSPEMVDQAKGAEFATTLVQQNIMLSKRVYMWQNKFIPFLTEHVQRYTINSGTLVDALREIVMANVNKLTRAQLADQAEAKEDGGFDIDEDLANLVTVISSAKAAQKTTDSDVVRDMTDQERLAVDAVVYEFIQSIQIALPRPESAWTKNQGEAFETYTSMLEKGLDAYISTDALTDEFLGDMANSLEPTKKVLFSYFLRRYMAENNILPELQDLTTFDPREGPAIDLLRTQGAHIDGLSHTLLKFMKSIHASVGETNKEFNKSKERLQSDGTTYEEPADTGGGDSGGDTADAGGDDATFDFPDMETEEPAAAEPEAEAEAEPAVDDAGTEPPAE